MTGAVWPSSSRSLHAEVASAERPKAAHDLQEPEPEAPVTALPLPPGAASSAPLLVLGGAMLVIAALYLGQDIFVPVALAALLAFALTPIVRRLRRLGLPRVLSVLLAAAAALLIIGATGYLVATQLLELVGNLPAYRDTLAGKLHSLRGTDVRGPFSDAIETFRSLGTELVGPEAAQRSGAIAVVLEEPARTPWEMLRAWAGPLGQPLATTGLVAVFVVILLIEREDLRDRFIALVSRGDFRASTAAIDEAAQRVSRYLLMQLVVNASYAIVTGVGLLLIGVPNAPLWGVLAGVLRFIPLVGQFIAMLFPLALALAVEPGWQMFLMVGVLFLVVELIYDYLVEPALYSASTGLSLLALIIAAIFWTTLWGPIGLVLATPLSVCLIVLGRHVPQLRFFDTLLGSDPALSPAERLYQRLLAANLEEAVELGEAMVAEKDLDLFLDEVAVSALRLAEQDRRHGGGDLRYRRLVVDGMTELAREVTEHFAELRSRVVSAKGQPHPRVVGTPVFSIGARTELDRAAAELLARALQVRGIGTQVLPPLMVRQPGLEQIDLRGVEVVCLCYLEQDPGASVRYVARRLRRRAPSIQIVACLLNASPLSETAEQLEVDAVVTRIGEAASLTDGWVSSHSTAPMVAPALPANEAERLRTLQSLGLTNGQGRFFDEVAAKASAALNTPIALVTVVDEHHQHWPGAVGLSASLDACRMGDRHTSICGHVVAENNVLVVEDCAKDPRFANNPFLLEHGIRFYAGVPLRTLNGFVIGTLCVIDYRPRTLTAEQIKLLRSIAANLMSKIEWRCFGFGLEGIQEEAIAGADLRRASRAHPV